MVPGTERLLETASRIPAGSTVFTDPLTGYELYGKTPLHTVAVPDQHSSPNDPDAARRIRGSQRILRGIAGPAETDIFLDRYGADYVMINESFPLSFYTYNVFISPDAFRRGAERLDRRPERFLPLQSPPGFRLYRVRPAAAPEEAEPPRADEPPAGPHIDADLPGGFRLLAGRLDRRSAAPGEIVILTTFWRVREEGSDVRPPFLFLRARRDGDPEYEPWGLRRDPVLGPWSMSPLGTMKDPAYLWRGGDRAREIRRIRVPRRAPPGDYRLEITIEPNPFFSVRRLDGLRRGASRRTWVAVDTLEVRS